jgi:hypothetical protein
MKYVNPDKLTNEWITALNQKVSLESMMLDYPRHIKLHLKEIEQLIKESESPAII